MTPRAPLALIALFALTACLGQEVGSEVDEGGFGNPTMTNYLVQTGQMDPVQMLGERFAREVPSTITFAFNSADLSAEAQQTLALQADWIRQFPELRFRVYGHTDLVGTDAYNKRLGQRRAEAVVAFFATRGIARARLEALVSYGETRPLIPTPGPEQQNRRTVTEVSGFLQRHEGKLDGRYAAVIWREYITGARPPATILIGSLAGGQSGSGGGNSSSGSGGGNSAPSPSPAPAP